jgi:carboxymethylenebutenolidase
VLRQDLTIRSGAGGAFSCYLVAPEAPPPVPAVVLASAIHGVDEDLRQIADDFAARGFLAAAPDLFWRSVPGALARDDARAAQRAQLRLEKIKAGEEDLTTVLAALRRQPAFNGRAAVMGFCYGGPYAILGPKRLGYAAGIACHGTQLLDFLDELEGVTQPVCLLWGDQDFAAPAAVLDAYRAAAARRPQLEMHVFPGVGHAYMMRGNAAAFDPPSYDVSMARASALLEGLREPIGGRR